ncbi:hypothetical protein [Spiroplasma endosymbiont of Aspidapion aeneum]|uniref:hypothetical protein n=1 Tax=Spiroplasma endosymbiont of Aspidapion aeneum TaxID=3066276 RepID=UPI00313CF5F4
MNSRFDFGPVGRKLREKLDFIFDNGNEGEIKSYNKIHLWAILSAILLLIVGSSSTMFFMYIAVSNHYKLVLYFLITILIASIFFPLFTYFWIWPKITNSVYNRIIKRLNDRPGIKEDD